MSRDCSRVAVAASVTALALMWGGAIGHAQGPKRTRGVEVRPENSFGGVEITLRLETAGRSGGARSSVRSGGALSVGDRVVLCFGASADGYLALWNNDVGGGVPTRIYPNEFDVETAGEMAVWVEGGVETCIGGEDDGFGLVIERPLGEASVYLHYTQEAELQFDESAFPVIRGIRGSDSRPYASSHLRYRVVD